jgi:hypothetical protein
MQIHVLAKNHEEEWKKLKNESEYLAFDKIKQGNYHKDWISERKGMFL